MIRVVGWGMRTVERCWEVEYAGMPHLFVRRAECNDHRSDWKFELLPLFEHRATSPHSAMILLEDPAKLGPLLLVVIILLHSFLKLLANWVKTFVFQQGIFQAVHQLRAGLCAGGREKGRLKFSPDRF